MKLIILLVIVGSLIGFFTVLLHHLYEPTKTNTMTAHEIHDNVKYIGDSVYMSELNDSTVMLFLNNGESVAPLEYLCKHEIVLELSEIRVLHKTLEQFLSKFVTHPKRPVHTVNITKAEQSHKQQAEQ